MRNVAVLLRGMFDKKSGSPPEIGKLPVE